MTDGNFAPPRPEAPAVALRFTGKAGEYLRIWIVNVCLSVITLGFYSPWAKVRRKRYFYGNTLLNDAGFEYRADPKAILKGRVIVLVAFAMVSAIAEALQTGIAGLILYVLVLPYVVITAARFNAVNSAYRNVRFHFGRNFAPQTGRLSRRLIAGYNKTSQFLILPLFLLPLSLGFLWPYYVFRKRQFTLQNSSYGSTPFAFDARPGMFYGAYSKAALLFILFLAGSLAALGLVTLPMVGLYRPSFSSSLPLFLALGAVASVIVVLLIVLPLYILFASYRDATVGRLLWKHTLLGPLRFDCDWRTWGMFKLHLGNSLGILLTFGLLIPWAAIRTARYQIDRISLRPAGEVERFVAAEQGHVSATGDEAGELLGFDLGL